MGKCGPANPCATPARISPSSAARESPCPRRRSRLGAGSAIASSRYALPARLTAASPSGRILIPPARRRQDVVAFGQRPAGSLGRPKSSELASVTPGDYKQPVFASRCHAKDKINGPFPYREPMMKTNRIVRLGLAVVGCWLPTTPRTRHLIWRDESVSVDPAEWPGRCLDRQQRNQRRSRTSAAEPGSCSLRNVRVIKLPQSSSRASCPF